MISEIYEKWNHARFMSFFTKNKTIQKQFGFQKGKSTEHAF